MTAIKQVTVIVPVYNLAAYLARCLTSLQAQTYPHFEVWLIDDGSTDGSTEILKQWVQKDARFQLWRQSKNCGVSAARNVGLHQAQGDYVCFVDGDDWCEPTYLESFVQQMALAPTDMVLCGYHTDWPSLKVLLGKNYDCTFTQKAALLAILKPSGDIRGFLWNKCYRLDVIRQANLRFDESVTLMEDQLFNVAYVLQTQHFRYKAAPQYHYVTRHDSAIHQWSVHTVPEELKASDKIQQLLRQHPELQFGQLLAQRRQKVHRDLIARMHQRYHIGQDD